MFMLVMIQTFNAISIIQLLSILMEHRIYLLLNFAMISSQTIHSTSNISQQESSSPVYSTIQCQNYNFRILISQYQKKNYLIFYTSFLWVVLGFASTILICSLYLYSQYYPFFITVSIGLIPLNGFAIYNKKIFGHQFTASSILLNLIIAAISVLLWFQLQQIGFAFGIYLILELIFNCITMQNKGMLMLKVLVYMQILMVCLKMDDSIGLEWDQALFGLVIVSIFMLTSASCILAYSLLIGWRSFRQTHYQIKSQGLRYLALNMLSAGVLTSIISWTAFINWNNTLPIILASILSFTTSAFTVFRKSQITLFLCTTIETLTAKEQNGFRIKSEQLREGKNIFQVSENWFTEKYDKETCQNNLKLEDCVACMQSLSESVWLPCGHSTLCFKCTNQLIANQKINCPLCKSKPSLIARITRKDAQMPDKILGMNKYELSDCLSIEYI